MKSFKDLREAASVRSADKKPEQYIGPDGKPKMRMVPVDRQVIKKEQAEDDMPASPDEKSMAMDQAKFLQYVGKEVTEYLNKNKEFPEWMQNKLSGLHEKAKDMHAVLAGDYDDDEEEMNEAAPKMKGDFIKMQREKDRAHDAAMGRTATGRKKPVRQMTSTQRSLASLDPKKLRESLLDYLSENDNEPLTKKHPDGRGYLLLHRDSSMMRKIRKGMTDHEKKHMAGAYRDDTAIVHPKTAKTMTTIHGKNVGQVRKEIQAHIAKHHPPQPKAGPVKHEGDTRSIVTASDEHANKLKSTFHGKNSKVRIMKRKEGNKVYIDSQSKEHHDDVKSKLNKMKHS